MKQNTIILLLFALLTTQVVDIFQMEKKLYPILDDIRIELDEVNAHLKKIDISNDSNIFLELLKKAL
tara:strand:- start:6 stop:206 length:201 start_codon:yes stop_codon:yes gene_type:complete